MYRYLFILVVACFEHRSSLKKQPRYRILDTSGKIGVFTLLPSNAICRAERDLGVLEQRILKDVIGTGAL